MRSFLFNTHTANQKMTDLPSPSPSEAAFAPGKTTRHFDLVQVGTEVMTAMATNQMESNDKGNSFLKNEAANDDWMRRSA